MRPPVKFYWRGPHHSYHGCWMIAFGIFNWYMSINNLDVLIPLWQVIIGLGIFMIVDDYIEHNHTADTPLRIIWEGIYKIIKK